MQLWSLLSPFLGGSFFVGNVGGTVSSLFVAACGLMTITSLFWIPLDIVGNPFAVEDFFFGKWSWSLLEPSDPFTFLSLLCKSSVYGQGFQSRILLKLAEPLFLNTQRMTHIYYLIKWSVISLTELLWKSRCLTLFYLCLWLSCVSPNLFKVWDKNTEGFRDPSSMAERGDFGCYG